MLRKCLTVLALSVLTVACSPNQRIVESNGQWSNSEANRAAATPVKSSLEQHIEPMRTADFVIRRKDGGLLDNEDKKFASAVIPGEMNRRTVADEGRAILIGSNFRLPDDSRKLVEERFAVEDLSREPSSVNANANSSQANR